MLTQRQAADTQHFQRLLTLVGTAVLIPGLVAAIFGANVDIPGKGGANAFWAMLLLMVAGAVGSYALLRSLEGRTAAPAPAATLPRRLRRRNAPPSCPRDGSEGLAETESVRVVATRRPSSEAPQTR